MTKFSQKTNFCQMKMHAFLINILYLKVFLECYKYFLNCFEVEFPS